MLTALAYPGVPGKPGRSRCKSSLLGSWLSLLFAAIQVISTCLHGQAEFDHAKAFSVQASLRDESIRFHLQT